MIIRKVVIVYIRVTQPVGRQAFQTVTISLYLINTFLENQDDFLLIRQGRGKQKSAYCSLTIMRRVAFTTKVRPHKLAFTSSGVEGRGQTRQRPRASKAGGIQGVKLKKIQMLQLDDFAYL